MAPPPQPPLQPAIGAHAPVASVRQFFAAHFEHTLFLSSVAHVSLAAQFVAAVHLPPPVAPQYPSSQPVAVHTPVPAFAEVASHVTQPACLVHAEIVLDAPVSPVAQ